VPLTTSKKKKKKKTLLGTSYIFNKIDISYPAYINL
jgi:hypothetical protein